MPKSLVRFLSFLFPGLMVRLAARQLNNPLVRKLRAHEDAMLAQAETTIFPFKGFEIKLYHWKGSGPRVLLIHGWEGQAGNFSDLVPKLLEAGMDVWAFDAPSHGYSSRGETTLFDFFELVGILIPKFGIRHLVSHSFGGVATTFALSRTPGLEIDRYVLITCPDTFKERIDDVSELVGITEKVKQKLIEKFESEAGMPISDMSVSKVVSTIPVEKALLLADVDDKIIPIARSRRVAAAWGDRCRLVEVQGTGHFRILRTDAVLDQVVAFLS